MKVNGKGLAFVIIISVIISVFIAKIIINRSQQSAVRADGTVSFVLGNSIQTIKGQYEFAPNGLIVYVDSLIVPTLPETTWVTKPASDLKQKPLRDGDLYGYVRTHVMQPSRRYFIPNSFLFWIE